MTALRLAGCSVLNRSFDVSEVVRAEPAIRGGRQAGDLCTRSGRTGYKMIEVPNLHDAVVMAKTFWSEHRWLV